MTTLYHEKDQMLAEFYQTGRFPYELHTAAGLPPKEVVHDPIRFLIIHVFFLVSSYVFWTYSEGLRSILMDSMPSLSPVVAT